MKLEIKIIDDRLSDRSAGLLPDYGTPGSAGLDLRACIEKPLLMVPGDVRKVSSGLCIHIGDPGFAAIMLPRSGLGTKGIVLGNLTGLIDSDYQGELSIVLWNRSNERFTINPMDRVAQLVIIPVVQVSLNVVEDFESETKRGTGSYGSTGHA